MAVEHKNNPAGRLYLILQAVWSGGGRSEPVQKVWRVVVKAEKESNAVFLQRMSTVFKLPNQVRSLVPLVPSLAGLPLVTTTLDKAETVLQQYFAGNIEAYQKKLEQTTLDNLQFISSSLSTSPFAEPVLEDDLLVRIQTEVADLFHQVQDSDLEEQEKTHLLNLLDTLAKAAVEVEVGGVSTLYSAANEVVGTMISEFPFTGVSPWRTMIATFAIGLAVNIATPYVEDHALPAADEWASGVVEYFTELPQLEELGEADPTKGDDDRQVVDAEVVEDSESE